MIYFARVGDDGPIKIGVTDRAAEERIADLRCGCPWPITIMGTVEGDTARERMLHEALAAHRMEGEWFAPHEQTIAVVTAVLEGRFIWAVAEAKLPRVPRVSTGTKLREWMRREGVDDDALAKMLGGCSPYAVKKWKYGEREPGAARICQIEQITNGEVTLRDFAFAPCEVAA